jgi:hypothetical protein
MHNLVGRVNQQVTRILNSIYCTIGGEELHFSYCFALSANPSMDSHGGRQRPGVSSVHTEPPLREVSRGTSETTRDATLKKPKFRFRDYKKVQADHITGLDRNFLTWLVGFIEGDGSFMARDANVKVGSTFSFDPVAQRGEFEIVQSIENLPLLMKIRTKVGFGRVTTFEKGGLKYCRWYTSERANIIRLIVLLNGNLVLEKRREQFHEWFHHLKAAWGLDYLVYKESTCVVSLEDAWLSGFSDADAGFATNATRNFRGDKRPKGVYYYRFLPKFYITQKGELGVLTRIQELLGATNKMYTVTNGQSPTKYNRMEVHSEESINKAIAYFARFPLKGQRRIDAFRWARVQGYKTLRKSVDEASAETLANLVYELPDPGEHVSLDQYAKTFTPQEVAIFERLPFHGRYRG